MVTPWTLKQVKLEFFNLLSLVRLDSYYIRTLGVHATCSMTKKWERASWVDGNCFLSNSESVLNTLANTFFSWSRFFYCTVRNKYPKVHTFPSFISRTHSAWWQNISIRSFQIWRSLLWTSTVVWFSTVPHLKLMCSLRTRPEIAASCMTNSSTLCTMSCDVFPAKWKGWVVSRVSAR